MAAEVPEWWDDGEERKSKSQLKREHHGIKDLGAELQSLRSNVQQHQQTVSERVNKVGVKESKELAKLRKVKEASLEKLEK